jgi:hypothetical protein
VLEIREIPGKGTDFLQIEGDAKSHQGSWRIEPSEAGTWLVYQATTEPDSSLPMAVIRYFLDKRLKNNFLEMAQRITDRGKVDCKAE